MGFNIQRRLLAYALIFSVGFVSSAASSPIYISSPSICAIFKSLTEQYTYLYDGNGNQTVRRLAKSEPVSKDRKPGKLHFEKGDSKDCAVWLELREYDGFGQMVKVTRDSAVTLYRYGPDGLRHSKEGKNPYTNTSSVTTHHWDGQNIVLETAGGSIKSRFLRGINLIAQRIDSTVFYYLFNGHGDVVQRVGGDGNAAPEYVYDSFGNQRDAVKADPNPFRFCGEYIDLETNTIYLRARNYSPTTGRFLTEDTYWKNHKINSSSMPNIHDIMQSSNLYVYCMNNPIRFFDMSGNNAALIDKVFNANFMKFMQFMNRNLPGKSYNSSGNNLPMPVPPFWVSSPGPIYNQADPSVAGIRMGYGAANNNGCGWVSACPVTRFADTQNGW